MSRTACVTVTLLGLAGLLACQSIYTVAPENATLELASLPDSIATGDTLEIEASAYLETGDLVPYGISVTLSTSLGRLCGREKGKLACGKGTPEGRASIRVETGDGVIRAILVGGGATGVASLKAVSGAASDTASVRIVP